MHCKKNNLKQHKFHAVSIQYVFDSGLTNGFEAYTFDM